jgi:hypothetical protein
VQVKVTDLEEKNRLGVAGIGFLVFLKKIPALLNESGKACSTFSSYQFNKKNYLRTLKIIMIFFQLICDL